MLDPVPGINQYYAKCLAPGNKVTLCDRLRGAAQRGPCYRHVYITVKVIMFKVVVFMFYN